MRLKIKELREEYQMTQKELAEKISNVQRNVSNWESGNSEPDCQSILLIAECFDVTIDELFGRSTSNRNALSANSVELAMLRIIRTLTETQKASLLQFLRDMKAS